MERPRASCDRTPIGKRRQCETPHRRGDRVRSPADARGGWHEPPLACRLYIMTTTRTFARDCLAHGGLAHGGLALVAIALASACTTLGPMPVATGVSPI